MKQTAHKGTTAKHAGTAKHTQGKGKHHPAKAKKAQTHHHAAAKKQHAHTAAKPHKVAKPRKLARAESRVRPGMTPFERRERLDGPGAWALADVACCAAEALAWSLRLAGWPVGVADVLALYKLTADGPDAGASILATLDAAYTFGLAGVRPVSFEIAGPGSASASKQTHAGPGPRHQRTPLILGLELPGPHAVCQQDGQWWTWGEPYDPDCFPDAVIEEAWAVTWP